MFRFLMLKLTSVNNISIKFCMVQVFVNNVDLNTLQTKYFDNTSFKVQLS